MMFYVQLRTKSTVPGDRSFLTLEVFFLKNSKPFKSYVTLDRIFWDALYTQIHFDQDLNVDPAKCTSTDPNRHHSVHFPLSKWLNFNNNPGGTLIYMHIPTQ